MKYLEQNDNCTRTYEITVDEERLRELVILLDRDCSLKRVGMRMLSAYTRKDAIDKIKKVTNHAGVLENLDFGNINLTKNHGWYPGQEYDANYEAVYNDSVNLVYWIESLLEYKDINDEFFENLCIECYKDIINYKNSIDFVPFEERVKIAENRLNEALISQSSENLLELTKAYANACIEAKLNKNYNYQRLAEIYIDVLSCFKLVLIEEVKRFNKR